MSDDHLLIGQRPVSFDLDDLSPKRAVVPPQDSTKAAIEGILAGALAKLGQLHSEQADGSTDRVLAEVVAGTMKRVMGGNSLDAMSAKIVERMLQ